MTPSEYVAAVAAVKQQPGNLALKNTLEKALRDFPELADARANDIGRYYRNNTVMDAWPKCFIYPTDEERLVELLEKQKSALGSFRAFGDGYGFANANATTGCLVRTASMNKGLPLEAENFRADLPDDFDEDDYVRVQGGINFEQLNALLEKTGRAVIQQPGFARLTVAGCSASGGHGSGLGLFGISGYVQAIELVNFDEHKNVRVVRVEPTDGLTDPAKYAAAHHDGRHFLMQDDVLFHAARCAQGHLGVVSALTLEVRKRVVLREDRYMSKWDDTWAALPGLFANPDTHSVHVWINPYTADGGANPNVLVTHLTTTTDTKPNGRLRGAGILFGGPGFTTDLANLMMAFGQGNPTDAGLAGAVDMALKACAATDVRCFSDVALDFGAPNNFAVSAASMGFDASRADEVVKALIPEISKWRATGNLVTSPIGMRWVKASRDFLSPQYGRDTVMLEMPILNKSIGNDNSKAKETLNRYAHFMMDGYDARPHWGQQNPMTPQQFQKNYGGAVDEFRKALKKLDPLKMFDGPLSQQLGLR